MSRSAIAKPDSDFFDVQGVVAYLHSKGLKHMTRRSVLRATYESNQPLKKTRYGNRVYWAREDVDAWIDAKRSA